MTTSSAQNPDMKVRSLNFSFPSPPAPPPKESNQPIGISAAAVAPPPQHRRYPSSRHPSPFPG